jgi:hypothetical protein
MLFVARLVSRRFQTRVSNIVRKTHVNIVDLIEWGRSDRREKVQTFDTMGDLRDYTKDTGKVFRNRFVGEDRNVVLRHLLPDIFRASL